MQDDLIKYSHVIYFKFSFLTENLDIKLLFEKNNLKINF